MTAPTLMKNDWWCGSYDDHEPHIHLGGHPCLGVLDRRYQAVASADDDPTAQALYQRVRELTEETHRLAMRNATLEQRLSEFKKGRDALTYISSPTMGLPGGRDALDFVDEASEGNVRLALKACIRTARQAMA